MLFPSEIWFRLPTMILVRLDKRLKVLGGRNIIPMTVEAVIPWSREIVPIDLQEIERSY